MVDRAGFRDRGWGLRKHEGAARRGLHVACMCELPDEALYMLLYENAAGERMLTNGWVMAESGLVDTVRAVSHSLRLDGRHLLGGSVTAELASGATRELTSRPRAACGWKHWATPPCPDAAPRARIGWTSRTRTSRGLRRPLRQRLCVRRGRSRRPRLRGSRARRARALPSQGLMDTTAPYAPTTIGGALLRTAARRPEHEALVFPPERCTYRELTTARSGRPVARRPRHRPRRPRRAADAELPGLRVRLLRCPAARSDRRAGQHALPDT